MKDHTLAHLDLYLETFEAAARSAGSEVHWAETSADARRIILDICRRARAKIVTKSKSMVGEEIRLNEALEAEGIAPVETDLGEYIIQLRRETPSHILAPAIHVTRRQVEEDFRAFHSDLDPDRPLPDTASLQAEARAQLRGKYFAAEVGITGANFLVAETGETGAGHQRGQRGSRPVPLKDPHRPCGHREDRPDQGGGHGPAQASCPLRNRTGNVRVHNV